MSRPSICWIHRGRTQSGLAVPQSLNARWPGLRCPLGAAAGSRPWDASHTALPSQTVADSKQMMGIGPSCTNTAPIGMEFSPWSPGNRPRSSALAQAPTTFDPYFAARASCPACLQGRACIQGTARAESSLRHVCYVDS